MLFSESGQQIGGEVSGIPKGFIKVIDQSGQSLSQVVFIKQYFVMFSTEVTGNYSSIINFVISLTSSGKSYRKGLNSRSVYRAHQAGDNTGIDTTAQENAQGNIRNEPFTDGLPEQAINPFSIILLTGVFALP